MSERTPMEKLLGIKTELITLKSRLPEPYASNVKACIKWCDDLEEHLTTIDGDEPTLTLTVEMPYEIDTICRVLQNAEENGDIDFGFDAKRT